MEMKSNDPVPFNSSSGLTLCFNGHLVDSNMTYEHLHGRYAVPTSCVHTLHCRDDFCALIKDVKRHHDHRDSVDIGL